MIFVGIDDTDTCDSRGTNQLAKAMARAVAGEYTCQRIVRHQLLEDPRVPCTSKNGAASLVFEPRSSAGAESLAADLADKLRLIMLDDYILGSDPGLCVATRVSAQVIAFAGRCQRELVTQQDARQLAAEHDIYLQGLGGTNDGVIGALAAVGWAAADDGGRVVQWQHYPDDLSGLQPLELLVERGIQVRQLGSSDPVRSGRVDVGKHLRPNWRAGRCVLYVTLDSLQTDTETSWNSVRLP